MSNSNTNQQQVALQFPPRFFFVVLALFLTVAYVIAQNPFEWSQDILRFILNGSFLFVFSFIFFSILDYNTLHKEGDSEAFGSFVACFCICTLATALPYFILISPIYFPNVTKILFWICLSVICIIAFFWLRATSKSFFSKVITLYSIIAFYLTLSISYYNFGIEPLSKIENFLPIYKDIRLILGLLSLLLLLISGFSSAVKIDRPELPFLPPLDRNSFKLNGISIPFFGGIINGIAQFAVRLLNVIFLVTNTLFTALALSLFYFVHLILEIFKGFYVLVKESNVVVIGIISIALAFGLASFVIDVTDLELSYLYNYPDEDVLKSILLKFCIITGFSLLLSIVIEAYDSKPEEYFFYNKLNDLSAGAIQGIGITLMWFCFTGIILWVIANNFGLGRFIRFEILPIFKEFGAFSQWALLILAGLLVLVCFYKLVLFFKTKLYECSCFAFLHNY
jgi:hypothetical protein